MAKDNYTRFAINNTERMRITSAGNVGIGTVAPTDKLNVVGNTRLRGTVYADAFRSDDNSGGNIHMDASNTGRIYLNYYDGSGVYFGN